jgi:hypothetical protein
VVKTDSDKIKETFPDAEDREFLMEMVEPAMHEGTQTLEYHQGEVLESVDDIEAFSNNMTRQKRRMNFLYKLYNILEGSAND